MNRLINDGNYFADMDVDGGQNGDGDLYSKIVASRFTNSGSAYIQIRGDKNRCTFRIKYVSQKTGLRPYNQWRVVGSLSTVL